MDDVHKLDDAWNQYLGALRALTERVRGDSACSDARSRAEAYNMIQALIANAYINVVYPDPQSPQLIEDYSIMLNYCAPTGDFKYQNVLLERGASYRVWGSRGTVHYIDFEQCAGWWDPKHDGPTKGINHASFDDIGIAVAPDGAFSFLLSTEQQTSDWMPKHPDTTVVIVRQMFYDWANETPAEIHFERIGGGSVDPPSPAVFADRIERAARSVEYLGGHSIAMYKALVHDVGFHLIREEKWGSRGGQIDQNYWNAAFQLIEDQALLLEWQVPESCVYWGLQLYNTWWQGLDFRTHQCSLNGFQARPDADGVTRLLISAKDPGLANWVDTVGHQNGQMLLRCKHRRGAPPLAAQPTLSLVRLTDLEQVSSAGLRRVTPAERHAQIATRIRHMARRFGR